MSNTDTPLPGSREWLAQKNILPEIAEEFVVGRYTTDNPSLVDDAYKPFAENQRKWAHRKALISDGILMRAHEVPDMGLEPIPPQHRPDNEIPTGTTWQFHPSKKPAAGYVPRRPSSGKTRTGKAKLGKRIFGKNISTAWAQRRHILMHPDHDGKAVAKTLGYDTPQKLCQLVTDPACKRDMLRVIDACNNEEPHAHEESGKYMLTVKRRIPWRHDHALVYHNNPDALAAHVEKWHKGRPVYGEHDHGKKTIEDDDPRYNPGKRIDILPSAWKRWDDAEVIHFVTEGKLKAASVLSYIAQHDVRASVCNVPSVGQWDAVELQDWLLRDCGDKIMVIHCDADGGTNPDVLTQMLLLRQRVRDTLGTERVGIFAPPLWAYDRHPELKGDDDWLGRAREFHLSGRLEDLESLGHDVPALAFSVWAIRRSQTVVDGRLIRRDRVRNEMRFLMGLSLLAGPGGDCRAPVNRVAAFVNLSDDSALAAAHSLEADGELRFDRPLETAKWQRRSKTYFDPRRAFVGSLEERPTISIVNPALHATRRTPIRLEEWLELQGAPQEETEVTLDERNTMALESIATTLKQLIPQRDRDGIDIETASKELAADIDAWNAEAA